MSDFTIAIIGAGVIGTSMGLALKQQKEAMRILGHDKDLTIAQAGVKKEAFDKADWNLVNACEKADLIILAIPVTGIRATLEAIGPYLKQGAVVTDTATTKQPVLAWAAELLPEQVHFVGGDPVVHAAGAGHENAAADLFREKLYCLTPAATANEQAVQLVVGLVSLLGADPFFMDAAEHDSLMTAVGHLPALLGAALINTLAGRPSWRELRKLAGGPFEQVTGGAVGDPDAIAESLLANHDSLVHWLDAYLAHLNDLRALLVAGEESAEPLAQTLDKAVVTRQDWLKEYQAGRFIEPELITQKIEKPSLMRQLIGMRRPGK
jgi:prephenate dehydrogenase